MTSISAIAVSGMNAAQTQLQASAHNVANTNAERFTRQQVTLSAHSQGGVSASVTQVSAPGSALQTDVVTQLQARNAFLANLAVFKASDKLAGALLDMQA